MFVWLAPRRTKHFSGQRLQQGGRDRQASRQANPEATEPVNGEVVIYDSCVYARYENICDQPRDLLRAAGLSVREPQLSGKSTHCCGGPLKSLFPAEAHRISGIRVDQLEAEGKNVVTMCPFCWVNLTKAAGAGLSSTTSRARSPPATGKQSRAARCAARRLPGRS